jgi:photosystem II stability/assembly factor-like uncharacterized protein
MPAPGLRRFVLPLLFATLIATPAFAAPEWEPIGPEGGTVLALAADPFQSGFLLAGTLEVGLFRSDDNGLTWSPSGAGLPPGSITQVVFDPRTPGTVYVGTEGLGVFKSRDRGVTWKAANDGLCCSAVRAGIGALTLDPGSPSTLYASRIDGQDWLFKTENGGRSWFPVARELSRRLLYATSLAVDPRNGAVYAGMAYGRGVYRSDDGGRTWIWRGRGLPERSIFTVGVHPRTGHVFAGTDSEGLYVSFDGGGRWRPARKGLPSPWVSGLAFHPTSPNVVYAATAEVQLGPVLYPGGVARSTDGGLTWSPAVAGLDGHGALALALDPRAPAALYAGTRRGGVFGSTAGERWVPLNRGLRALPVAAVSADPGHPSRLVVAAESGLFRSEDGGQIWSLLQRELYFPPRVDIAIDPARTDTIFATAYRKLWRSRSDGASWRRIGQELDRAEILGSAVLDRRAGPPLLYLATFEGVARSADEGRTWAMTQVEACSVPLSFALAGPAPGRLYLGAGYDGRCGGLPGGGIFRTDDAGLHWTKLGLDQQTVHLLAVSPDDPETLYAAVWGAVVRSADGGATWDLVPSGASRLWHPGSRRAPRSAREGLCRPGSRRGPREHGRRRHLVAPGRGPGGGRGLRPALRPLGRAAGRDGQGPVPA